MNRKAGKKKRTLLIVLTILLAVPVIAALILWLNGISKCSTALLRQNGKTRWQKTPLTG